MEMGKMNVLSLFDGISGGRQALERAGIEINNYYASEIDKYAIQVTMANYPDTIQLGSVTEVDGYSLPKIDMLIGGSPCQSFSFAGKRKGMSTKCETEILTLDQYLELKNEGFEFEGQSFLFWEYMRLLNEVKPKYFLLENVMMSQKWEKILTQAIGVNPIMINSSLVSAQNRKRFYWTNIGAEPDGFFGDLVCKIKQPKDKKILLKDILESEVDPKYFLSEKLIAGFEKHTALCPMDSMTKVGQLGLKKDFVESDKAQTLLQRDYKGMSNYGINVVVHNLQTRSADRPSLKNNKNAGGSGHLSKSDGKTYCLDTGNTQAVEIKIFDCYNNRFRKDGKCGTLTQNCSKDDMRNGFKVLIEDEKAVEIKRQIITHNIPEIVSVRKYEVDVLGLQKTLKEHKKLSNQQIADELQVPKTMVEHWFRTDIYFSIPDKDIWYKLKELLEIKTNEFDESIITFEEREGTFDKANRVYDEDGIAPTLTTMSENERILVRGGDFDFDGNFRERENGKSGTLRARAREDESCSQLVKIEELNRNNREVIQLNNSKESGGQQPYQQNRVYSDNGLSPCLDLDSNRKSVYTNSRIRRLTPIECERLQTVKEIENVFIFDLCFEKAKNYVNAVQKNHKLQELVLNAEKSELNELVKSVLKNMNVKNQLTKHIVPQNADMQTLTEIKKFINTNQEEININVNNVKLNVTNQHHKEMDFVAQNVFINITEGKITQCGLGELHPKDNCSFHQKNGKNVLNMSGKEIMQIVEDVEKNLNTNHLKNSIYTMSYHLNTKNIEQMLIIYYLFAKNVIFGYTQDSIQKKNLSLKFKLKQGYTNHVSDSQRYKMIGNGWTIDVIAHIFSYIKK